MILYFFPFVSEIILHILFCNFLFMLFNKRWEMLLGNIHRCTSFLCELIHLSGFSSNSVCIFVKLLFGSSVTILCDLLTLPVPTY